MSESSYPMSQHFHKDPPEKKKAVASAEKSAPTAAFVDSRFGPGAIGERDSTSSDPAVAWTSRNDPEPALQSVEIGAINDDNKAHAAQKVKDDAFRAKVNAGYEADQAAAKKAKAPKKRKK